LNGSFDLESIYAHLEEVALDYKSSHEIARLFQKVKDIMHEEGNADGETKAQWEMDFFNFTIVDNTIKPMMTRITDKGEQVQYPSYNRFDDRAFDYLTKRLDSTNNPLLKAMYAHILWFSPKKHGKYAQIAIDSYLQLTKLYEEKDKENSEENDGKDIIDVVKNAYFLSVQINDRNRLNAVKSEILRLTYDFNIDSRWLPRLRVDFIELMMKQSDVFSMDDFAGLDKLCYETALILKKRGNIHFAISFFELGERVDTKLNRKSYDWKKLVAESYEELMRPSIGKNNLVAVHFCREALKCYRQIHDKDKIKELEGIYDELKTSVEYKEFKVEVNLEEHMKTCKAIAEKVNERTPDEIIALLTYDENLLPKYKDMEAQASEETREHPLQTIFPIELHDERGHVCQHFSTEEEMRYYRVLEKYRMYLEVQHMPLINSIIFETIKSGKLTLANLNDYFKKHSWFGKTLKIKLSPDEDIEYNWLSLIAPSLYEYFKQMDYSFLSGNYPILITCMDSLVLKLEGMVRDLCNFFGINSFYQTNDTQGRLVFREKDLNSILREEDIKRVFDENDLLLFRFVLIEQAGYNLRNKIAHSLMISGEYIINYMHLLLLILLRIGKYELRTSS